MMVGWRLHASRLGRSCRHARRVQPAPGSTRRHPGKRSVLQGDAGRGLAILLWTLAGSVCRPRLGHGWPLLPGRMPIRGDVGACKLARAAGDEADRDVRVMCSQFARPLHCWWLWHWLVSVHQWRRMCSASILVPSGSSLRSCSAALVFRLSSMRHPSARVRMLSASALSKFFADTVAPC